MFCYNCGKQLLEGAKFCPYCGAENIIISSDSGIKNPPLYNKSQNIQNDKHTASIKEIQNVLNYFSQNANKYKEFDKVTAKLNVLRGGRSDIQKKLSRVLLLISAVVFLVILGIGITGIILSSRNNFRAYTNTLGGLAFFAPSSVLFIMFLYLWILSFVAGIVLLIVDKSRDNSYQNNLKFFSNRYFELSDELYLNYLNYNNCPVKAEYTNPANIFVIQKALLSGQAESIDEAIAKLSNSAGCSNAKKNSQQIASFAQKTALSFGRIKTSCQLNAVFLPANCFSSF